MIGALVTTEPAFAAPLPASKNIDGTYQVTTTCAAEPPDTAGHFVITRWTGRADKAKDIQAGEFTWGGLETGGTGLERGTTIRWNGTYANSFGGLNDGPEIRVALEGKLSGHQGSFKITTPITCQHGAGTLVFAEI